MSEKNEIFFNYEPPIEIAPGKTAHPPNISRAVTLIEIAGTPGELDLSGDIYSLVAGIQSGQAIAAIKAKINR